MKVLLAGADAIDSLNRAMAAIARWTLLADALLIAGNALSRKLFSITAAVIFDLQWHFFAAAVLLTAGYALQRDEHVRVDVFANRVGPRGMACIDLAGFLAVLVPLCLAMVWLTIPQFAASLATGESRATRENLSELPAAIIRGLVPLGFALLALQGVAEAIRCFAFLRGLSRARREVDAHAG